MSDKERPQMGQWVIITARAAKRQSMGADFLPKTHREREELGACKGIYIGYRRCPSGEVKYGRDISYDPPNCTEYRYFHATKWDELWLVVLSEHQNPVYVFPDDVEWE